MDKTVYQVEFKNKLGTRMGPIHTDLESVIEYLEHRGFERIDDSINTFKITETVDNYVVEKVNTLAIIHEVPFFKGSIMPKDHVYLKDEGGEK